MKEHPQLKTPGEGNGRGRAVGTVAQSPPPDVRAGLVAREKQGPQSVVGRQRRATLEPNAQDGEGTRTVLTQPGRDKVASGLSIAFPHATASVPTCNCPSSAKPS